MENPKFEITSIDFALQLLFQAESFPPLTLGLLPLQGGVPLKERQWQRESRETRDASLCYSIWVELFPQEAKAGHIRRFGNIPALKPHLCGSNPIGVFEI